jgi:hypothetical protein
LAARRLERQDALAIERGFESVQAVAHLPGQRVFLSPQRGPARSEREDHALRHVAPFAVVRVGETGRAAHVVHRLPERIAEGALQVVIDESLFFGREASREFFAGLFNRTGCQPRGDIVGEAGEGREGRGDQSAHQRPDDRAGRPGQNRSGSGNEGAGPVNGRVLHRCSPPLTNAARHYSPL